MKKLLSLLLFVPLFTFGQTNVEMKGLYTRLLKQAGQEFNFSKILDIPNKSKNDLYFQAKTFFVEHYPNGTEVIQLDDKEQGVVAGKSSFSYREGKNRTITYYYYLKIQSKDGRSKVELKDISYVISDSNEYGSSSSERPIRYIDGVAIMNLDTNENQEDKVSDKNKKSVKSIYSRRKLDPRDADKKVVQHNYGILKGLEEGVEALFSVVNQYLSPEEETW